MKVVISTCYGGFGLSRDAIRRLEELDPSFDGRDCYISPEAERYGAMG